MGHSRNRHGFSYEKTIYRSERLAVSLAYALPSLTDLSLTRITRSAQHAHDLLYDSTLLSPYPSAYPNTFPTSNPAIPALEDTAYTSPSTLSYSYSTVPIVVGDEDIVPPSRAMELGIRSGELRLPVLLMLRGLRRLKIRDTHMGDPMWCVEEGRVDGGEGEGEVKRKAKHQLAPLEVLDLGSCAHESPAVNEQCTARILRRVPSTIKSFSLSTALPDVRTLVNSKPTEKEHQHHQQQQQQTDDDPATSPSTSAVVPTHPVLPHLRTLHLTPLVPLSALQTTLAQPTLAESPVHTLSVAFHPDDAGEGCEALVAFLGERGVGVGVGGGLGGVKGDNSKVGRRRSASVGVGVFATKPSFSSPLTRGCTPSSSSSTSSSSASRQPCVKQRPTSSPHTTMVEVKNKVCLM